MFGSFIFIYAYKYALKSIFHRLSIEFASNLHRVCIGFATEDHWRKIEAKSSTFTFCPENQMYKGFREVKVGRKTFTQPSPLANHQVGLVTSSTWL